MKFSASVHLLLGFLFIIILLAWQKPADKPFHTVAAQKGDSQKILLERYELAGFSCNVQKFREINQLKWNSPLLSGKKYKIPVYLYSFNGKSIRSSIGNNDFDAARRIQLYNERMLKQKLRAKTYQESKILWVPVHEKDNCRQKVEAEDDVASAVKPTTSKGKVIGTFPIFGQRYSRVVAESTKLKGKVFFIESGHGGPDPGATAKVRGRTLCEDEYAYDIALRVALKLMSNGATVYVITRDPNDGIRNSQFLSCDCDEQTYPAQVVPTNQKKRLFQRSDAINKIYDANKKKGIKDQRSLVIHVESRGSNESVDAFFYHKLGSKEGQRLATNMHKVLKSKYKHRNYKGTVTTRDLHMLREPKSETVFVEIGNIKNTNDQKRLMLETNRRLLAEWLYLGLIK